MMRYSIKGGQMVKKRVSLWNMLQNGVIRHKVKGAVVVNRISVMGLKRVNSQMRHSSYMKVHLNFFSLGQYLISLDYYFIIVEYDG